MSASVCLSVSQLSPEHTPPKSLTREAGSASPTPPCQQKIKLIHTKRTHTHSRTSGENFCQSSAVLHTHTHTLLQTACAVALTCGDHSTRLVYCNAFSLQCVRPELLQWCLLSVELGPIRYAGQRWSVVSEMKHKQSENSSKRQDILTGTRVLRRS